MVHADAASLPQSLLKDKASFYEHISQQLEYLLDNPKDSWISATAQASNLLYHAYREFHSVFGSEPGRTVNWVGFYLVPGLLHRSHEEEESSELRLGPFSGKPACQKVSLKGENIGVCAQAFVENKTILVPNVHERPGHITCDSLTNSEIVIPLKVHGKTVGVFDLDCEQINGFDEVDKEGLEKFTETLSNALDPVSWK